MRDNIRRRAIHIKDVKNQYGVIRRNGPPGFANDSGMLCSGFIANSFNHIDDVRGILLGAVIATIVATTRSTIVINTQPAADIQQSHRRPQVLELCIDAGGLSGRFTDSPDVWDL